MESSADFFPTSNLAAYFQGYRSVSRVPAAFSQAIRKNGSPGKDTKFQVCLGPIVGVACSGLPPTRNSPGKGLESPCIVPSNSAFSSSNHSLVYLSLISLQLPSSPTPARRPSRERQCRALQKSSQIVNFLPP